MTILPKAPTTDLTSTTLNGSINSSQTNIVVNDASTIQTPTYAWIDRQDINGNNTPNSREMIYVSSKVSNTLTASRGVNNSTARAHNDAAILEPILSVGFWADAYSWSITDHLASDGSHDITKIAVLSGATVQTLANKILSSPTIVSATYVSPILSNATLITPTINTPTLTGTVSGWVSTSVALTYSSADAPTFVATTGSDLTGVISVGMRIQLTQTTPKYFIVTAIDASSITLYGGTDYTLANAAISNVFYSSAKAPQGFPQNPTKWTVKTTDTGDRQQATPVAGTWYNLGSITISIPIGAWRVRYEANTSFNRGSAGAIDQYATLSTANNTESDAEFTGRTLMDNNTAGSGFLSREKFLVVASKTSYFLNSKNASGSSTQINFLGSSVGATIVEAICAYL